MTEKLKEELEETQEEVLVDCGTAHHWVIDIAEGPSSKGTCKKCGETRPFSNSIEKNVYGSSKL